MDNHDKKDRIDISSDIKCELGLGPPPEGYQLIGRIRRINALYVQMASRIFQEKFGSNCGEYDVLGTIYWGTKKNECLTPGEIANMMILSSPALTNRVNRLEAKGLVFRDRGAKDRRQVLIGLTPEGRKMAKEMEKIYDSLLQERLEGLEKGEQDELAALLRKMVLCFEK